MDPGGFWTLGITVGSNVSLPELILVLRSKSNCNPAGNYMFKVNNRNTRGRCEICSKLTIKTPERHNWRRSGVCIVNFEHISHLLLVFLFFVFLPFFWVGFTTRETEQSLQGMELSIVNFEQVSAGLEISCATLWFRV